MSKQNDTQPEGAAAKRARCEIPGCESPAIYRGTCKPEHFQERALRRRAALRGVKIDGPSEPGKDGNADLDAFRAGAYNVVDREAVVSSLCDEVERLRAALDKVADDRDEARAVFQRHTSASDGEAANLRELLRAVLTAIDLPRPAAHIDWELARRELLQQRVRDVRIGLDGFLNGIALFETTLDWVRRSAEDYPVDYKVEGGDL